MSIKQKRQVISVRTAVSPHVETGAMSIKSSPERPAGMGQGDQGEG